MTLAQQLAEDREIAVWREIIRRALADCSTVDFHSLSDAAVDNLALVAAQAVHKELAA